MNNLKKLEYWFTPEGGDEYEIILNNYYKEIVKKANSSEVIKKSGFDVLKLEDYPEKGMYTFLTKGLSIYILGNQRDGYIRREQSITVDSKYLDVKFDLILDYVGQHQLEMRRKYERDEIINLFSPCLSDPIISPQLNKLFFVGAVWFDDDSQGFFGDINTNISEILLVSESESKLIEDSVDDFIEMCQSGKIDILDLNRV